MTRPVLPVGLGLAVAQASPRQSGPVPGPLTLWYRQPADQWVEALPVGNGRLAAMVFGGVRNERLQLNEDTLWSGGPYDPANPDALAALPRVRRLIFKRQYTAAHALIGEKMMAKPLREMPFQPLGDLTLAIPAGDTVEQYRRALDLDTAIARVMYVSQGVTYTRDVFSSPVDQVVVIRLTADRSGQVSVTAGLTTPQEGTTSVEDGSTLVVKGRNGEAPTEYRRELNLDTAIARVSYVAGGVRFVREVLSSPVDQVIVVRLTADRPGALTLSVDLTSPRS